MKDWFWNILISVDQFANTLLGPVLNFILRPTNAKFGDPDETLSSVFGKNVEAGACHGCKIICKILHLFDPDHCRKSIEEDEGLV